MTRCDLQELWDEWWSGDIWIAPWDNAVDGLRPDQAAWAPAPDRHSIWQNVQHVIFWRRYTFDVIADRPLPSDEEIERQQFAAPAAVTEEAWDATCAALAESHRQIKAAIADEGTPIDRLLYHLAHDAYHLGQIMLLRSLQGLPPVL